MSTSCNDVVEQMPLTDLKPCIDKTTATSAMQMTGKQSVYTAPSGDAVIDVIAETQKPPQIVRLLKELIT